MNLARKIARQQEKDELKFLQKKHGIKPVVKCPKCNRKSIFSQNGNEYLCIRCNQTFKKI